MITADQSYMPNHYFVISNLKRRLIINRKGNKENKPLTLSLEESMVTPRLLTTSGPSSTAQRAETTSEAVWIQRRKGETKTRWIGNPRSVLSFRPVQKALIRPASTSGGSHGLVAVVTHNGSRLSIRSPCLITTTFCRCIESLMVLFSGKGASMFVSLDVQLWEEMCRDYVGRGRDLRVFSGVFRWRI
jgi:hypothetical protein